jgi:hypothetical protein
LPSSSSHSASVTPPPTADVIAPTPSTSAKKTSSTPNDAADEQNPAPPSGPQVKYEQHERDRVAITVALRVVPGSRRGGLAWSLPRFMKSSQTVYRTGTVVGRGAGSPPGAARRAPPVMLVLPSGAALVGRQPRAAQRLTRSRRGSILRRSIVDRFCRARAQRRRRGSASCAAAGRVGGRAVPGSDPELAGSTGRPHRNTAFETTVPSRRFGDCVRGRCYALLAG